MGIIRTFFRAMATIGLRLQFLIIGKPKLDKSMAQTLKLYKHSGFAEIFSLTRLWDAPFVELDSLTPQSGTVVDLGCGDGIITNFLAIKSSKRVIYGYEIDPARAKQADKSLKNVKIKKVDILKLKPPKADAYLLVHVLHHLPDRRSQELLLKRLTTYMRKGDKLIIAEIAYRPLLKFIVTWIADAFWVPMLFEGRLANFGFYYRSEKQWEELLRNQSLKVATTFAHKGKPFSHVIFVAEKA